MNRAHFESVVPTTLAQLDQWVVWKLEDGRKIPYRADGRGKASSTNAATWATFAAALEGAQRPGVEGPGVVFAEDDGLFGMDLDDCILEDGTLAGWASELLNLAPKTYTEISPSGSGLKAWYTGTLPKSLKRPMGNGAVELYDRGRYFTVTGNLWRDAPSIVADGSAIIAYLYPPEPKPEPEPHKVVTTRPMATDRRSAYGRAALARAITDVAMARVDRNNTLNAVSYSLGRLVAAGCLSADDVDHAMTGAGRTAGLTPAEVRATVKSGLTKGMAEGPPDNLPDFDAPSNTAPTRTSNVGQARDTQGGGEGDTDIVAAALARCQSLETLLGKVFAPTVWIVPGLLPEGAIILSGPPKLGKSQLAMNLTLALGYGGTALGKIPVAKGEALYIDLENGERRAQDRFKQLLEGDAPPGGVTFVDGWPRVGEGGDAAIRAYLTARPNTKLIVVDTLKGIRPVPKRGASVYDVDYEAIAPLQAIAKEHRVCILIIHHNRKAEAADFIDRVSGSQGLTGATDGVMVISRARGQADATLHVTGRDIAERELALRCKWPHWEIMGDAAEYRLSAERQRLVAAVKAGHTTPQAILTELQNLEPQLSMNALKQRLKTAVESHVLTSTARGVYALVANQTNQDNLTNQHNQTNFAHSTAPDEAKVSLDSPKLAYSDGETNFTHSAAPHSNAVKDSVVSKVSLVRVVSLDTIPATILPHTEWSHEPTADDIVVVYDPSTPTHPWHIAVTVSGRRLGRFKTQAQAESNVLMLRREWGEDEPAVTPPPPMTERERRMIARHTKQVGV